MGIAREGYHFAGWNTEKDRSGTNWHPGQAYPPTENKILYAFWASQGEHKLAAEFRTDNASVLSWPVSDFEWFNEAQMIDALRAQEVAKVFSAYNRQLFPVQELLYQEKVRLTSILEKVGVGLTKVINKPANPSPNDVANRNGLNFTSKYDVTTNEIIVTLTSEEPVESGYANAPTFADSFVASTLLGPGTGTGPLINQSGSEIFSNEKYTFITLTGIVNRGLTGKVRIVQKNPSLNLLSDVRAKVVGSIYNHSSDSVNGTVFKYHNCGTLDVWKERLYISTYTPSMGVDVNDPAGSPYTNDGFMILIADGLADANKKATFEVTYNVDEANEYTKTFVIEWAGLTID